jgi:hypothetical protein
MNSLKECSYNSFLYGRMLRDALPGPADYAVTLTTLRLPRQSSLVHQYCLEQAAATAGQHERPGKSLHWP